VVDSNGIETGSTGPTGIQGEQGPDGIPGETGIQGDRGDRGDRGEMGPQGIQGIQGPTGSTVTVNNIGSITGPTGEQGPQGPKGEVVQQLVLASTTGPTGPSSLDAVVNQGAWTPQLQPNRGGVITTNIFVAEYLKLGNMVSCVFDISIQKITGGNSSGTVELTGLPFSSRDAQAYPGSVVFSLWSGTRTSLATLSGIVSPNALTASLWCNTPKKPTQVNLTQGDLDTNTRLVGVVTYLASI
jgi:hypothetical protein